MAPTGKGAGLNKTLSDTGLIELVIVSGKTIENGEFVMVNTANSQILAYEASLADTYEFLGIFDSKSIEGDGVIKGWVMTDPKVMSSMSTSAGTTDVGKVVTIATATTVAVAGTGPVIGFVDAQLKLELFGTVTLHAIRALQKEGQQIQLFQADAGAIVASDVFLHEFQEKVEVIEGFCVVNRALDASASITHTFVKGSSTALAAGALTLTNSTGLGTRAELPFTTAAVDFNANETIKVTIGGTVHSTGHYTCGVVYKGRVGSAV